MQKNYSQGYAEEYITTIYVSKCFAVFLTGMKTNMLSSVTK